MSVDQTETGTETPAVAIWTLPVLPALDPGTPDSPGRRSWMYAAELGSTCTPWVAGAAVAEA